MHTHFREIILVIKPEVSHDTFYRHLKYREKHKEKHQCAVVLQHRQNRFLANHHTPSNSIM